MTTKEDARYYSDKQTIESQIQFIDQNKNNKYHLSLALGMLNVLPENYERWLKDQPLERLPEQPEGEEIDIIWDKDLQNWEEDERDWIIDRLIPNKSVCITTGKRGTLKTFLTLLMGYAVASGRKFLDHFTTQQGGVIYLDKENGVNIMKSRVTMIKNGLGLEDSDLRIGFICFSQLKIDKLGDICLIEKAIEKHKPLLLVIDTYRRGISFDENDAGRVSQLFVDTLRPLVEKYNISIILIHHNRKGGHGEAPDEMDELRGSSDLANYADIILKIERKRKNIILKQLKNRNAPEEKPIKIDLDFNEEDNYVKMMYEGEYIKRNKADVFAEKIIIHIKENDLQEIKTKDLKELALKFGIKKNAMYNAIKNLQDRGILIFKSYGVYDVSN